MEHKNNEHKAFVGNLAYATTNEELQQAFESVCGEEEVVKVNILMDRETGRSKGFGFVTFKTEDSLNKAIEKLNGYEVHSRNIKVDKAQARTDSRPPRKPGGFGGGSRDGNGGGRPNRW